MFKLLTKVLRSGRRKSNPERKCDTVGVINWPTNSIFCSKVNVESKVFNFIIVKVYR